MSNILTKVCESENIHIRVVPEGNTKMYKNVSSHDGALAAINVSNGDKYIFLSPNQSVWERKLCVAHELAHHIFGHLNKNSVSETDETEARMFAAAYLALEIFCTFQSEEKEALTSPPTKA